MRLTSNRIALMVCAYLVLLQVVYASVTPFFEAPDEAEHFLYAHELLETHRLPIIVNLPDSPASVSGERHQPPLYYLIGAFLVSWTDRSDIDNYLIRNPLACVGFASVNNLNVYLHPPAKNEFGHTSTAIWVMRLFSISLSTATLWFVYRTGQIIFPGTQVGLPSMLLVASIPSFVHIGASINNDNLVTTLYAIGVYWSLRLWRRQTITRSDMLIVSLVLAGASLSKLTGLGLFIIVYASLLIGVLERYYAWQLAARLVVFSLLGTALIAGWWYIHNQMLYGDPLAINATMHIWSRGVLPNNLDSILSEARGVWMSFWMVLGHFSILGPGWAYYIVLVISLVAVAGLTLAFRRFLLRDGILLALVTCGVVLLLFFQATRRVNVSQGRILFPALVAIAPLVILGWETILGHRLGRLLVLPLVLVSLWIPAVLLPQSYSGLEVLHAAPASAQSVSVQSETLRILAYQFENDIVNPGDIIRLHVYFQGQHPENPVLSVNVVDPIVHSFLGGTLVYPGMTPTSCLDPDMTYEASIAFYLSEEAASVCSPCQLDLVMDWRDLETGDSLPLATSDNIPLEYLVVPGPVLIDSTNGATSPEYTTNIVFGQRIELTGYSLSATDLHSGDEMVVTLYWKCLERLDEDWVLALGLLNSEGEIAAQADGMVPGFPSSSWPPGLAFPDTRVLVIPPETASGEYRLYVGWYRLEDGERLPAYGEGVENHLYLSPTPITILP